MPRKRPELPQTFTVLGPEGYRVTIDHAGVTISRAGKRDPFPTVPWDTIYQKAGTLAATELVEARAVRKVKRSLL